MIAGRIEGATRILKSPTEWNNKDDGVCAGLAIKDDVLPSGINCMASVWHPTTEELLLIQAGAPIKLWIVGQNHPAVHVGVSRAPNGGAIGL